MPDPIYIPNVDPLPVGQRPRGYVLTTIEADLPNAINAGLNQTQAFNAYKEAGLGANYPAFRQLYNDTVAAMSVDRKPNVIQAQYLPLTSDVVDWNREQLSGTKMTYRYKEEVNIAFYDTNTGQMELKLHALYHNDPMTIAEIQSEALAFYQDEAAASNYQRESVSAALYKSFQNADFVTSFER